MSSKILKNKPLLEAIFELRWELQEIQDNINKMGPDIGLDPQYQILIGRIYDRINKEYPFYEKLPSAKMPEEISGYIVQQRFRINKDKWPLIQLGPGIITLNDTDNYSWMDFENRIRELIDNLYEAYPDAEKNLSFNKIQLRYIDSVNFDYENNNLFEFLKENMKVFIKLPNSLFEGEQINSIPIGSDLRFSYTLNQPKGTINLRFVLGTRKDEKALIWETTIVAVEKDVPQTKEDIIIWANEAHKLSHDWFFKIIKGELEKRFE